MSVSELAAAVHAERDLALIAREVVARGVSLQDTVTSSAHLVVLLAGCLFGVVRFEGACACRVGVHEPVAAPAVEHEARVADREGFAACQLCYERLMAICACYLLVLVRQGCSCPFKVMDAIVDKGVHQVAKSVV